MLTKKRPIIVAYATYQGERVAVIDVVGTRLDKIECMIIYDGPKWINIKDLSDITWN